MLDASRRTCFSAFLLAVACADSMDSNRTEYEVRGAGAGTQGVAGTAGSSGMQSGVGLGPGGSAGSGGSSRGGPTGGASGMASAGVPGAGAAVGADAGALDGGGPSGSGMDAGRAPLSHATDIQPIWDLRCVIHCHVEDPMTEPGEGLELWPDGYPAIVNVPSKQSDLVLVQPGDLEQSYLWRKLDDTFTEVGGSGMRMPFISELEPEELATIRRWILEGAAP